MLPTYHDLINCKTKNWKNEEMKLKITKNSAAIIILVFNSKQISYDDALFCWLNFLTKEILLLWSSTTSSHKLNHGLLCLLIQGYPKQQFVKICHMKNSHWQRLVFFMLLSSWNYSNLRSVKNFKTSNVNYSEIYKFIW